MGRLFFTLLMTAVLSVSSVYPQLQYVTKVNLSNAKSDFHRVSAPDKNNIYFTFKRAAWNDPYDLRVRAASSNNGGISFIERDITIPTVLQSYSNYNPNNTYAPYVASTPTSAVYLYDFDSAMVRMTCMARTTDGGNSFTLQTVIGMQAGDIRSDNHKGYYLVNGDKLFVSEDDGANFVRKDIPEGITGKWFFGDQNIWVINSLRDTLWVYRSTDKGSSFKMAAKFRADLPYGETWTADEYNGVLYMAFVARESNIHYLRIRTVSTTVSGNKEIYNSADRIEVPKIEVTENKIFMEIKSSEFGNGIMYSTDGGKVWSKPAKQGVENSTLSGADYIYAGDNTFFLSKSETSGDKIFGKWDWTDFPTSSLNQDSTIVTSNLVLGVIPHVITAKYRYQIAEDSLFSSIIYDTTGAGTMSFQMKAKFQADGKTYYYRIQGVEGNYKTAWSPVKRFRYGMEITVIPQRIEPADYLTFEYPNRIYFEWSGNPEGKYIMHMSSSSAFTDTVGDFRLAHSNWSSSLPYDRAQGSDAGINGTFYWRVRSIDLNTYSMSPWSSTGVFTYTNAPITGVEEINNTVPEEFYLSDNYPNPFNPSTTIEYGLPAESVVKIEVYNSIGELVWNSGESVKSAGRHRLEWRANVSGGVYFYRINAVSVSDPGQSFVSIKKMIMLK